MKILLTGASGYVGGILNSWLKKNNEFEIITAGRKNNDQIYINILQPNKISKIELPDNIDILIHVAAYNEIKCKKNILNAYIANIVSTRILVEKIIQHKVKKIIYISTFHVYGEKKGNLNESIIPKPLDDYGMTHYQAEQIILMLAEKNKININIIRLGNLYGKPEDWNSFDRWSLVPFDFIKQALQNKKIILNTDGKVKRNFISKEWLEFSLKKAINNKLKKITNISGIDYEILDLAKIVAEIVEKKIKIKIPIFVGEKKYAEEEFNFHSIYFKNETDKYNKKIRKFIEEIIQEMIKDKL